MENESWQNEDQKHRLFPTAEFEFIGLTSRLQPDKLSLRSWLKGSGRSIWEKTDWDFRLDPTWPLVSAARKQRCYWWRWYFKNPCMDWHNLLIRSLNEEPVLQYKYEVDTTLWTPLPNITHSGHLFFLPNHVSVCYSPSSGWWTN